MIERLCKGIGSFQEIRGLKVLWAAWFAFACLAMAANTQAAGSTGVSSALSPAVLERMAQGAFLGEACSFPQDIYSNLRQIARLVVQVGGEDFPEDTYLGDFRRFKSRFAEDAGIMHTIKHCYVQQGKYKSLVADIDNESAEMLEAWQRKAEQKRAEEERRRAAREQATRARDELAGFLLKMMDHGLGQNILDRAWPLASGNLQYRSTRMIGQETSGETVKLEYSIRYVNLIGLSQSLDVSMEIDGNASSKDNLLSVFRITDYSDFIPPKSVGRSEVNGFIRRLAN
jgi:hypothetical protein